MKTSSVRRRRVRFRRLLPKLLGALALLAVAVPLAIFAVFWVRSADYNLEDVEAMPQRATVFDMDGKPYARLYGENRIVVPLKEISPKFIDALLAREDSRFYSHFGVDPIGVVRAIYRGITRSKVEGASTLTQQLARNTFPLGGRNLTRKLLEACVTLRIERRYSKDEILTHYINRIYYGAGLLGIESASLAYFGKHAKELDLSEAALMAGLIRSPNRFSPLKNPKGAELNRNDVLNRMVTIGKITQTESDMARAQTITTSGKPRTSLVQENYAMDAIKRDLDTILEQEQQDDGGLQIYSTIDPELQAVATKALEDTLTKLETQPGWEHPKKAQWKQDENGDDPPTEYVQGALIIIDNRTGAIRALVGGRDYAQSKFNRAILAKRQIGSSFKPFIYAAAFQRGALPGQLVNDGPIEPGELHDLNGLPSNWSPGNSDDKFNGYLPMADGLIRSRNTMSARVGEQVTFGEVSKLVTAAGLTRDVPNSPTIYLGAFEATLKDLTAAYTAFPSQGIRRQPYLIERIDDDDGDTVYKAAHLEREMFKPAAAWLTSATLEKVLISGSAARARSDLNFKLPAAGKTGTTNDFKDAWFIGYTSTLTCGVWVGLDRPATIMRKGYGSALALPVWTQVMMRAASQRYPANAFKSPEPLQKVRVCSRSNKLATAGCEASNAAYLVEIPQSLVPTEACGIHMDGNQIVRSAIRVDPNAPPDPAGVRPQPAPSGNPVVRTWRRFFGGR